MNQSRFNANILDNDPQRRARILPILEAALDAVDPAEAMLGVVRRQGDVLRVREFSYDLNDYRSIYVVGFGKAATPMASAVRVLLGNRLSGGVLATKYGHGPTHPDDLQPIDLLQAGHPVPDEAGLDAARQIVDVLRKAGAQDLIFCLVSGGGSALLTLPAEGISLADLQATTQALLGCGATIHEINAVRKHLSQVKGGQLARLAAPATLVSLLVSDVVGSSLDVIASGPTVPDGSTWADAWAVINSYDIEEVLPEAVRSRLQAGLNGMLEDTPKAGDSVFARCQTVIIADNAIAAGAAAEKATESGFNAAVLSTFVEGEAKEVAKIAVALGREVIAHGRPLPAPACLIFGGETTVTIRGGGKGGRNQELALAASLFLNPLPERERLVLVSLASDGTDGPTDSAGGIADGRTVERGQRLGLSAADHLANNDSYPYLQEVGDLLLTGPTRTNVNDLIFVFVFE
ncbi:MAG: glycerate kinase [Chloroflexi bacterium]|nr:glycerate kinase [Chloroflexota bacterium]